MKGKQKFLKNAKNILDSILTRYYNIVDGMRIANNFL